MLFIFAITSDSGLEYSERDDSLAITLRYGFHISLQTNLKMDYSTRPRKVKDNISVFFSSLRSRRPTMTAEPIIDLITRVKVAMARWQAISFDAWL